MNRFVIGIAGLAMAAGTASAAFIGIDIREDKTPPSATGLAGFPATNPRVFNMYALFDGAGTGAAGAGFINTVLSVGQNSTTAGVGINLALNPGANFYQSPGAAGGATIGGINLDGAGDNRRFWNTYLSIGVKTYNGDYGPVYGDTTSADPDFGFSNRDSIGTPALQANDIVRGGWFNSNPPNLQGAAKFNGGTNQFETFLGQFSIKDLNGANELGSFQGGAWVGSIFEGELTIFRQGDTGAGEPAAIGTTVRFLIPTPGAMALFSVAGLAAARRRR